MNVLPNEQEVIFTSKGVLEAPITSIYKIACSPDSKTIAACGLNTMIWLWSITDPLTPRISLTPEFTATAIAFNADGSLIVAGGLSTTLRVWYINNKVVLQILMFIKIQY